MSITIEAVYENGVFRPTKPVTLQEGARVQVTVTTPEVPSEQESPADILAEIAAFPIEGSGDAHTAREHDRVLYGNEDHR